MLPLPHRIYAIYSPNIILCWLTKPTHYTASDHWTWQSQHSALPQNSGPNNAITLHYLKLPNPHPRAPHCTSAHRTSTAQHSSEQQVALPWPSVTSDRCIALDQTPTLCYVTLHRLYKVNTGTPRGSATLLPAFTRYEMTKLYLAITVLYKT